MSASGPSGPLVHLLTARKMWHTESLHPVRVNGPKGT